MKTYFLSLPSILQQNSLYCAAFCKLGRDFGFSCCVNHFSEGVVNANHNVTCLPSLAKNDFSCPRIVKEITMVSGFSVEGVRRRYFILSSDKNEKDHKNLRSKPNQLGLLPETGRSQSNEP